MLKVKTLIVTMLIVFNLLELPSFAFNYNDNFNYSCNNQNSGFNINLLKIDFSGNSFNMSNTFNVNRTLNPELKIKSNLIAAVILSYSWLYSYYTNWATYS